MSGLSHDIGEPRVPPEISDNILGYLQDDIGTLQQCSLVCRNWLPASTLHLFRHLQWPPCSRPGKTNRREDLGHSKTAAQLEAVLRTSPRLRGTIQELTFTFPSFARGHPPDPSPGGSHDITPLIHIICLLPYIRALSITGYFLGPMKSLPTEFLHAFTLEELSFTLESTPGIFPLLPPRPVELKFLVAFMACFQSVSRLTVGGVVGARDSVEMADIPDATVIRPRSLRVTSFSLGSCDVDVLEALSVLLDFESVQSLQLYHSAPLSERASRFISQMTNLQSLWYSPCGWYEVNYWPFAGCPPLRRLTFKTILTITTNQGEATCSTAWPAILRDLRQFDLCELQELVIEQTVGEEVWDAIPHPTQRIFIDAALVAETLRGHRFHWQELETILHRQAPKIHRLEFKLYSMQTSEDPYSSRCTIGLFETIAREMLSSWMNDLFNIVLVDVCT